MMPVNVRNPEQLTELVGREIVAAKSVVITQALIDEFCAVSGDYQWIHSSEGEPSTVPGNLLIALLPQLVQSSINVESFSKCLTARYESVKFRQPVYAGDRIGLSVVVLKVKTKSDKTYCEMHCKLVKDNAMVVEARVTDAYYQ